MVGNTQVEGEVPVSLAAPIKEEIPVPPSAPVKEEVFVALVTPGVIQHHKRASLGPELEKSMIYDVDLDSFRVRYDVLVELNVSILSPDDRVVSPL